MRGWLILEDPYFPNIIEKGSFDQVYDEHVYFFTALSVQNLGAKYGFQLVDVKPQNVHGGSMRYYLKKSTNEKIGISVDQFLHCEIQMKLNQKEGYQEFSKKIEETIWKPVS